MKKLLLIILVLLIVAGVVAGNFFYNLALNPKVDKSAVFKADHNALTVSQETRNQWAEDRKWLAAQNPESWTAASYDNLTLHAQALMSPHPENTWVIICHGYNGHGQLMANAAREFRNRGYSVLLPDARGCGKSEGDYFGMGWHDRLDVKAWIEVINQRHAPANIFLYGVSMGGATVLMTSGEQLPENLRAIIDDCGYASVKDEFSHQMKHLFGLPSFPLLDIASIVTRIRASYWLGEASAEAQVAKSKTPILFIHGSEDTFVPPEMVERLYNAAQCEKEKLIIDGAGHAGSSSHEPETYWNAIDAFLEKHLVRPTQENKRAA